MAYFDKHLGDGERVILVGKPSWWLVIRPLLLAVATIAVLSVVAGMLAGVSGFAFATVFAVVLLPLFLLVSALLCTSALVRVLTTEIVLTDRRVASKKGWLSIAVTSTPLDKVNNINVQQGIMGRMFNYGDLEVTTATAEEKDNHNITFLAMPNRFRDEVNEAIDSGV